MKYQDLILQIIQSTDQHMTAEDIFLKCKSRDSRISVATVYRNLGTLVEQGLIAKIPMNGQPEHYDRNVVKHEHMFCERCKQLQDVYVDDLGSFLEERIGMRVTSYDLCIRYICPVCREKESIG